MIQGFLSTKRALLTSLLTLTFLGVGALVTSAAPTPNSIAYQGFLTSATGTAQTGTTTVTVRLYDASTGGTLLFEELHPTTPIVNGYFSVQIGSVGDVNGSTAATGITDLLFDKSYYLTVELGSPFSTGEMTTTGGTRSQLGTVPFANIAYGALQATSSTGLTQQKGKMYFNTGDNQLYIYNGTAWNPLSVLSTTFSTLTVTGTTSLQAASTTALSVSGPTFLNALTLTSASSTGGITATSFYGALLGTATLTSLTVTGNTTLANASSTNLTSSGQAYLNNASATALTATNLVTTNSTSTNSFITSLLATLANITDLVVGNSTTTNAVITNATIANATATGNVTTNTLTATGQATLSTASATALTATALYSVNSVLTNATATLFAAVNASTTFATTSRSYITTLIAASSTLTDALLTRSTTTDAYITRLVVASSTLTEAIVTTLNAVTLNVSGQTTLSNASATALSVSGPTFLNALTLTSASSTGGITATTFYGALLGTANLTSLLVSGQTTLSNASATNLTVTNNLVTNNLQSVAGTSTNFFATLFNAVTSTVSNLFFTSATGTDLVISNTLATNNFSATSGTSSLFTTLSTTTLALDGGNVGIGTTTAAFKLTVDGSVQVLSGNALVFQNASGDNNITLANYGSSGQSSLNIGDSLYVQEDSNVGVGTTSPAYNFTVGARAGDLTTTLGLSSNHFATFYIRADENNNSATADPGIRFYNDNAFQAELGVDASDAGSFKILTGGTGGFNSGSGITLTTTGNVGIGTTSPGSLLTVQGNAYFGGSITATGTLLIIGTSTLATTTVSTFSVSGQTNVSSASATALSVSGQTVLSNASTTNISGTGLSFTSGFISALTGVNASTTNLTVSGQTYLTNASSTAGITAATFYGALIGSASLSTLTVQGQSSLSNASTSNLSTTNLYATGTASLATASATSLTVSGQTYFSTASGTGLTATNIYGTNANITNATTSTFFATLLNAVTAIVTNLTATNATATNLVTTNSTSTNSFISSLVATLANITDLVVGNSTTTNAVITNASTTNLKFVDGTSTGSLAIQGRIGVNPFSVSSSTGPIFTILENGNVGIGTTTSSKRLEVVAGTGQNGIGVTTDGNVAGININLSTTNPGDGSRITFQSYRTSDGILDGAGIGAQDGMLSLSGTANPNTSAHLVIDNSGNVGIGTTTPTVRLSVSGNTFLGGNLTATGTLSVSGQSTLSTASATALTVSDQTTLGLASTTALSATTLYGALIGSTGTFSSTLNVAGNTTLSNASATNLSISNNLVTSNLLSVLGTSTLATTTASSLTTTGLTFGNASSTGGLTLASLFGANLAACNTSTEKLLWANGTFTCGTDAGGAGGTITSLNGSSVASQSLATSTLSTVGLDLFITSSTTNGVHTFSLTPQAGYSIPLTASSSNWNNFFNTPVSYLTAGANILFSSTSTISLNPNLSITSLTTGSTTITGTSTLATTTASTLTVSGQSTLSNASATNLSITGQTFLNALTLTSASSTGGITATTFYGALLGTATLTSLTVTGNTTLTNASSTNLTSSGQAYLNNASATALTATNLVTTNSTSTNSFISSLLATLANITDLVVGNSTTTNAVITNATIANATATGNITTDTLTATGQASFSTASATALTATTFYNSTLYGSTALLGTTTNIFDSSKLVVQGTTTLIGTTGSPTALRVIGNIDNTATSTFVPQVLSSTVLGSVPQATQVVGNYAYFVNTGSSSISVIDISNKRSPEEISFVSLDAAPMNIAISGNYAYVAKNNSTLSVIDISNPKVPVEVATMATLGATPYFTEIGGNYLYINNFGEHSVSVVDISNPRAPHIVGELSVPTNPEGGYISGKYLYITSSTANALSVIDISSPTSPVLISTLSMDGTPVSVYTSGRYAYVSQINGNNVAVVDISDPSNLIVTGTSTSISGPRYVAVSGRYAYTANSGDGTVSVLDIADPNNPIVISTVSVGGSPFYLTASERYIYVTDITGGEFSILDLGGLESTSALIHSLEAGNLSVRNDIQTGGILNVGTALTVGQGGFLSQGNSAVYGSFTVGTSTYPNFLVNASNNTTNIGTSTGLASLFVQGTSTLNPFTVASSSGASLFTILADGKVGVGTSSAYAKLDIYNADQSTVVPSIRSFTPSGTYGHLFEVGNTGLKILSKDNGTLTFGRTDSVVGYGRLTGSSDGISFSTSLDDSTYTQRMNLSSSGVLGIGTQNQLNASTSNSLLNVAGKIVAGDHTSANGGIILEGRYGAGGALTVLGSEYSSGGPVLGYAVNPSTTTPGEFMSSYGLTSAARSAVTVSDGIKFYVQNSTTSPIGTPLSLLEAMKITSDGNIGIASSSPVFKLGVVGTFGVIGQTTLSTASATALTATTLYSSTLYGTTALLGTTANTFDTSKFVVQGTTTLIGTTGSPTALKVIGDIDNSFTQSDWPRFITSTTTSAPGDLVVSNGFMYVISGAELSIYNVVDINNPLLISTSSANGNNIEVVGNYVYILGSSFSVVDVTDKRTPVQVGSVSYGSSYGYSVIRGQYAYVSSSVENSLKVIDINDPRRPKVVASLSVGSSPRNLAISGNILYLVDHFGGNLYSIDISNPLNPILLDTLSVAGGLQGVQVSNGYVYVQRFTSGGLYIVDASNPSDLSNITSIGTGGGSNDIKIFGRYAYVPNYNSNTFSIIDIGNPRSPLLVKNVSTGPQPNAMYVDSGTLYLTNYGTGQVSFYDLPGIESVSALIHSLEAGNLSVRNDLSTQGMLTAGTGLTVGSGGFLSQGNSAVYGSLQVGTSTYPNFLVNTANNTTNIGTSTGLASLFIQGTSTLNPFTVASSTGASLFTILANGNVGVGTSSPNAALDIRRSTSAAFLTTNITNEDLTGGSRFLVTNASGGLSLEILNSAYVASSSDARAPGGGSIYWSPSAAPLSITSLNNATRFFTGGDTSAYERMRIDVDGNVGIGTSTPGARFDIKAATNNSLGGLRILSSTNNNVSSRIFDGGDEGFFELLSGGSVNTLLRANGNSYLGGGNVGIGTSSPQAKLHVYGGDIFGQSAVGTANFILGNADGTTNAKYSYIGGASGQTAFGRINDDLVTKSEFMRIDSSGNVGIGTSSMLGSSKLFVEGSINIPQNYALRANNNWLIGQSSSTNTINIGSTAVAGDIQFDSSSGTGLFIVKSGGNIGIGSTTPFAKLSIGGFSGTGIALTPTDNATILSSFNDSATGDPEQLRISHNLARVNIDNLRSSLNLQSYGGDVVIGTTSPSGSRLDIYHNTSATSTDMFRVISDVGSTGNVIYTIKANGDIFTDGNTTIGTPADLAENYPTSDPTITPGMVVSLASTTLSWSQSLPNGSTTDYEIAEVKKASLGTEALGVISTRPGILLGGNTTNGIPVAFSGRIPVYVSNENGIVRRGDSLTISSSTPGYAMKQTTNGQSIGRAISDQDGNSTSSLVMMIVEQKERTITVSAIEGLSLLSSSSTPPTTTVRETLLARLSQGFSVVREYVAVKISAVTGYFDTVFAGEVYADTLDAQVLCLGEGQSKTCVTKEKLDSLLLLDPNNTGSNGGQTEGGSSGDTNGLTGDLGGGETVNGTTTDDGSENGTTTDIGGPSGDSNTENETPDQNQTPEGGAADVPPEEILP